MRPDFGLSFGPPGSIDPLPGTAPGTRETAPQHDRGTCQTDRGLGFCHAALRRHIVVRREANNETATASLRWLPHQTVRLTAELNNRPLGFFPSASANATREDVASGTSELETEVS